MKNSGNRVVLITGASSGFGKLTAEKLLATGGWIVYAASRRVEKMRGLEKRGARLIKMDVASSREVNAGVGRIIRDEGRIDALLSNAGYGTYGMIESVPMEEILHQYEVNLFSMARVLKAVLPHMRRRRSGRIVLTSSLVSHISTLGLGWYASTKHALRAMGVALRQEVKEFGIDVVMIEPGAVKTGFDAVALGTLRRVKHPGDYREYARGFDRFLSDAYRRSPGPEGTADCMVKALTAAKPKTVYKTTIDAKVIPGALTLITDRLLDRLVLSSIKRAAKKMNK
jgi:NAD(P)-dependent dehydrogenase (short-subunit alcohol dehydrogenase family)